MVAGFDESSASSSNINSTVFDKCIIKLALADTGDDPVFRRVRLSGPTRAFQVLKHHAMELALASRVLPNGSQTRASTWDQVVMLYIDIDGDKALISSDAELEDALNQYASAGSVKIMVKTIATTATTAAPGRANGAPTESATQTTGSPNARSPRRSAPNLQLHLAGLAESLVTVLATSVIALSGQIQNVSNNVAAANRSAGATRSITASPVAYGTSPVTPSLAATSHPVAQGSTPAGQPSPPVSTAAPAAQESRPFIHGRHTCDNCLTTPIVGRRYHAIDLPDFDLCQTCKDNYQGPDTRFEAVELDRDRPHQDRWHHRHSRFHGSVPHRGERRCGQRYFHGHGRPHGQCRHNGNGCPSSGPSGADCFTQEELAVAEAIRMSLNEVSGESTNNAPEQSEEHSPFVKKEGPVEPSAPQEGEWTVDYQPETDIVIEPSAPVEKVTEHSAVDDSFASDAAGSGEIAAALGATLDRFAKAIDEVSSEFDRKPAAQEEDDEEDEDEEEEFVIDAAKKGEQDFVDADEEEEFLIDSAKKGEEDFVDADEEEQGTKIIEGPDDDVKDDASRGSWQVVAEDQQIDYDEAVARAAQMIGSAMFNSDLANSAGEQLSALSHSVASASSSSASSSSGTSVSSATSVPTLVPSLGSTIEVPATQLERWDMQLQQLHELGFYNDALCVDILERLSAANIGVDSQEEVTVTQVVNQLMKDW